MINPFTVLCTVRSTGPCLSTRSRLHLTPQRCGGGGPSACLLVPRNNKSTTHHTCMVHTLDPGSYKAEICRLDPLDSNRNYSYNSTSSSFTSFVHLCVAIERFPYPAIQRTRYAIAGRRCPRRANRHRYPNSQATRKKRPSHGRRREPRRYPDTELQLSERRYVTRQAVPALFNSSYLVASRPSSPPIYLTATCSRTPAPPS